MSVHVGLVGEIPAITLSNDALDVTVLSGKGADIYSIRDKESGIDPLWKARWGSHHARSSLSHGDSASAWLAACAGGWNLLFPSGGAESTVGGGLQPMHGEASITSWEYVPNESDSTSILLRTHLSRSPFALERRITLEENSHSIVVTDLARNEGGEPFPCTWTQHPTLGPPFLDGSCVIDTNADTVELDDTYLLPHVPSGVLGVQSWSDAREVLARVPDRGVRRQLLAYLHFTEPESWYCVTSERLGFTFRLTWSTEDLPHAWFFQELDATSNWPWFSNTYIMAIEPSNTFPGRGLAHAIDVNRAQVIAPGDTTSVSVTAWFGPSR
jgi:hypothetical protein